MVWLLVLVLAASSLQYTLQSQVRGCHPDNQKRYVHEYLFHCQESKQSIAANRVNDNYCDCADGSDEPGTAACSNGTFHCANLSHAPKSISSSFVDDGICDCCDGSDEQSGCTNTCSELDKANRDRKLLLLSEYKAGASQREELVNNASATKKLWEKQIAELKPLIQDLPVSIAALLEEKTRLDEVKRQHQAAVSALSGELPTDDDTDAERSLLDESHGEHLEDDDGVYEDENEDDTDPALAGPSSGLPAGFELPPTEDEDVAFNLEEEGRRIAAQWTSDPDAAGHAPPKRTTQKEVLDDVGQDNKTPDEGSTTGERSLLGSLSKAMGSLMGGHGTDTPLAKEQAALKAAAETANAATSKWTQEVSKLRRAEKEVASLESKLSEDFGPDGVFTYMDDTCYESQVDKYTYRVCGLLKATQVEGGSTSLGTFSGYGHNYSSLEFTKGAGCWQGPPRSLSVKLQCGATTKLTQVTEPSRCQYAATLITPASCTNEVLQALETEVAQLAPPLNGA